MPLLCVLSNLTHSRFRDTPPAAALFSFTVQSTGLEWPHPEKYIYIYIYIYIHLSQPPALQSAALQVLL